MLVPSAKVVETVPQIVEIIRSLPGDRKKVLIAAPSHSGKTFTSMGIEKDLTSYGVPVTLVRHDWWNLGVDQTPVDAGIMEANNADRFENAIIHELLPNGVFRPPVYDSQRMLHMKDEGEPLFFEWGVLVLDGAFVFLIEGLRKISDLNVYIDIPWDIRRRWLEQCYRNYKGLSSGETRLKLELDEERNGPVAMASVRYADVILQPPRDSLPVDVNCKHRWYDLK